MRSEAKKSEEEREKVRETEIERERKRERERKMWSDWTVANILIKVEQEKIGSLFLALPF